MKKIIFVILTISLSSFSLYAWDLTGSNQAEGWISQPGYSFSYREALDLNLRGGLNNGLQIMAGIRYQQDDEIWNDSTTFKGLSKKYLELQKGDTKLRLGNYYAFLGRGIILNCVNDNLVKLDRELEGALLNTGYLEFLEAKALAGRIFENTARIDSRSYYGGEMKLGLWSMLDIGGSYLRANATDRPDDVNYNKPAEESFGGNIGIRFLSLDFYGEYDVRHTYGMLDPALGWIGADDVKGMGFYSSIGWTASGIGVVIDYKDYKNMNSLVNAPPTCNRDGRLLNQAADEQGLQVDFTVSPWESIEMHGNYSTAGADKSGAEWEDVYFEVRWELSPPWVITTEARARTEDSLETEVVRRKYRGGGVECRWLYDDQKALTLRIDGDRFKNLYVSGPLQFDEIRTEASWVPLPYINLYGAVEISDKRLPEYDNQRRWGKAGAVINIGQFQKVDISAGQYKGGLVCSGGFCRYEPPFKGFKAAWLWSF